MSAEWFGIYSRPGWHTTVWILDINGDRFVITAAYAVDAPANVRAQLDEIVNSIDMEP